MNLICPSPKAYELVIFMLQDDDSPSAQQLCRNEQYATFALEAGLRHLQACEACELSAAISTGTGKM
jgi:hypothetical protein